MTPLSCLTRDAVKKKKSHALIISINNHRNFHAFSSLFILPMISQLTVFVSADRA